MSEEMEFLRYLAKKEVRSRDEANRRFKHVMRFLNRAIEKLPNQGMPQVLVDEFENWKAGQFS